MTELSNSSDAHRSGRVLTAVAVAIAVAAVTAGAALNRRPPTPSAEAAATGDARAATPMRTRHPAFAESASPVLDNLNAVGATGADASLPTASQVLDQISADSSKAAPTF